MADLEKLKRNLEERGFAVSCFDTAEEAAAYLDAALDQKTIGIGGSVTIQEMGLAERLGTHNRILSHWTGGTQEEAAGAQVYLSSVNGAAETGELINIDGTGNRVASGLFGHEKVYFIIGQNKVAPDYDAALWRARNIAAPKNAQRMGLKTPCAVRGDRCYDCKSPDRICQVLTVLWGKPMTLPLMEVILVDEALGY